MSLRENAAKMAGRADDPADDPAAEPAAAPEAAAGPAEPLPDFNIDEPGPDGPEQVPVHVAWSRVMGDIRKIAKDEVYSAPGTRYNFRGVDRTVNAFAPVLRSHGVLVLPVKVVANYRDTRTSQNKATKETTVTMTWLVMGPAGDTLPHLLESAGEALDNSDKGTAKAQSVALRVLLLTGGMVPTGEPDPDSVHIERGEAPVRSAASYRDEALEPGTSRQRLLQIHWELKQQRRLGEAVISETGDQEAIGVLVERIGRERFGKDRPEGGEG